MINWKVQPIISVSAHTLHLLNSITGSLTCLWTVRNAGLMAGGLLVQNSKFAGREGRWVSAYHLLTATQVMYLSCSVEFLSQVFFLWHSTLLTKILSIFNSNVYECTSYFMKHLQSSSLFSSSFIGVIPFTTHYPELLQPKYISHHASCTMLRQIHIVHYVSLPTLSPDMNVNIGYVPRQQIFMSNAKIPSFRNIYAWQPLYA